MASSNYFLEYISGNKTRFKGKKDLLFQGYIYKYYKGGNNAKF